MNSTYYSTSALGTAPPTQAKTGTITSTGKIVYGTNTKFLTELVVGGYIFRSGTAEIRQIASIVSDTQLYLEEKFATNITPAIAVAYVPPSRAVSIAIFGDGAAGTVNGVALKAGEKVEFNKYSGSQPGSLYVDPVVVNGTGGLLKITILT